MADADLRGLERASARGDVSAAGKLLIERKRAGQLDLPPIPWCPACYGHGGPRIETVADRYMNHAGYRPCSRCQGWGDLSGEERIQLAAFAGDEAARIALDPKLRKWVNPNDSDMVEIPSCDRYSGRGWLDCLRRKWGYPVTVIAVCGLMRALIEGEKPSIDLCECSPHSMACSYCHLFQEKKRCRFEAVEALRAWAADPSNENLRDLVLRQHDYGEPYQRMIEGCDALLTRHRRGYDIFREGYNSLASGKSFSHVGGNLRRAVRDYARGDYW